MRKIITLLLLAALVATGAQAQESLGKAIVNAIFGGGGKDDPTHKTIDAGGMVGLVLPKNITQLGLDRVSWEPVDNRYLRVNESSKTSATVQGLRSTSSTVINAKYTYKTFVDGKEKQVTEKFPFTIKINRIDPEAVSLPQIVTVGWGVTSQLSPRLTPAFSECGFMYDSDDVNTVTVNENGVMYGVKLGETDITVRTSNGLECSTHVRCVIPAVTALEITGYNKKNEKIVIGDELQLGYNYGPEHSEPSVTWSTNKPEIATVDQNGLVKFLDSGTVHVILTDKSGASTDVKIKVKKH